MHNIINRWLVLSLPMLAMGCSDATAPGVSNPGISTTAISSTSVSLAWTKATDTRSPASALVYEIYISGPNPAYQSFDTLAEIEAGTLVETLTDADSVTISSGITAGNAYYFNIVVQDEHRNRAPYDPLGEYFHAGQVSYYPFNGTSSDVGTAANHLVVATGLALPIATADRFSRLNSAYNFTPTTPQCLQSTASVGATVSGNTSRSVSLWVQSANTPAGTERAPFAWGNGTADGSSFGFFENGVGNTWTVWLSGTANVATTSLATTSWEHWVVGYESAADLVYTYKNGALINNGTAPAVVAATVDTLLYVGCGQDAGVLSYPYQGNIDDVRIFNQLLSGTNVTNLYTVTQP